MATVPTEHAEQTRFIAWCDNVAVRRWPEMRLSTGQFAIFAIPNGGNRSPVTGKILKQEGVRAGVPDLFFPAKNLLIEMKRRRGGTVNEKQRMWHEALRSSGYQVHVARGCEEAIAIIEMAMNEGGE